MTHPKLTKAPHQDRYTPFPLSDLQQAYLVGRVLAGELGEIGCHFYYEFERETLDFRRLAAALNRLIARHDMLRAIVNRDNLLQVLPETPAFSIPLLDLRSVAESARARDLEQIREAMSHRLFDPYTWPLFDVRVCFLPESRIRLHFSFDLLILDAASILQLLGELHQAYEHPDVPAEPIEIAFRDYALAMGELRSSARFREDEAYWTARLATLPPAPGLPQRSSTESLERPRFVRRAARLEKGQWQSLKLLAGGCGLTPSSLLCALYSDVLAKWSNQFRFTLNVTLFQRFPLHPAVAQLLGDFTSTTLLEVDATGDEFSQRAAAVQRRLIEDLSHSLYSGVRVLRGLHRQADTRGVVRMPVVFTSLLSQQAVSGQSALSTAWLGEPIYGISQTPQVWLDHQVLEDQGALLFHWDCVDDLFPPGLLDDMFGSYCRSLQRLAQPGVTALDLARPSLPPAQRARRSRYNATTVPRPDGLLHGLFEEQARKSPHSLAVDAPGRSLTYGDLARCSNALAHQLIQADTPESPLVAIVMEKGWEQVVGAIAVLKSGRAFLPIDPDVPPLRLRYQLENAQVRTVLTQSSVEKRTQWPNGLRKIAVDREVEDSAPSLPAVSPSSLAYVIYTSGSSGEPKGVMIDHRGAVNTIRDINRRFAVGPQDRVLALSALSFDLSIYDVFGILACGGAVVIPEPCRLRDPAHWLEKIRGSRVTIWNSVPALMQMLTEHLKGSAELLPEWFRLVLLSGDWIPVELPGTIRALAPKSTIISLGGATEASVWSILYPINAVDPAWKSIPYGMPMENQRIHVLDEMMEPCCEWTKGEIYIGGAGLALGYLGDPEKTASRFIRWDLGGERLYRTGDLGRFLPDGYVEFLGRSDAQVKIRGHRIELGEIEAGLLSHPQVKDAVAVAADGEKGRKFLIGYVTRRPATVPEPATLRPASIPEDAVFWESVKNRGARELGLSGDAIGGFGATLQAGEFYASAVIRQLFARRGLFRQAEEQHTVDALVARLRIVPRYRPLLVRWLGFLESGGLLQFTAEETYLCRSPIPMESTDDLWAGLAPRLESSPHLRQYLRASADGTESLLRGELDPLSLLFPEGSWEVAEELYQENPVSRAVNQAAARVMEQIAAASDNQLLRVLEVGAGIGSVTSALLPVLSPDRTEYWFTDVSGFFRQRAQEKFAVLPVFSDLALWTSIRQALGIVSRRSSSIARAAANVLHNASDLQATLTFLRRMLAPRGVLLLIEATANTRIQAITVDFIEGLSGGQRAAAVPAGGGLAATTGGCRVWRADGAFRRRHGTPRDSRAIARPRW